MEALRLPVRQAKAARSLYRSSICSQCTQSRRLLSTQPALRAADELEENPSLLFGTSPADPSSYDPVGNAKSRKYQLPPSRYQYRPPRYYRGPLHPHQPPPAHDPASREFIPGPFSNPRMQQTYQRIVAPDFMTMCYQHTPPGFRALEKGPRLRPWIGDSPYFKNRPLRGPRGGDVLRLLRKPITFNNIPYVQRITLHSMVRDATVKGSPPLHVAGLLLQSITGKRAEVHRAKKSVSQWHLIAGKPISLTVNLEGEDMYHFLSKLITIVLPRIKDWRGIRATSGDSSGNLTFGLEPETVAAFPEVETNYDAYPPKMIPGMHITIHTTASTDKDARLLLQQLGVPFYGKIVN